MKKYTVLLMTSMVFFKSFQALGADGYEIEAISDSVVGKLWKGHEVPEQDVKALFSLVAESTANNKMDTNHNYKNQEAIIKEWENEMIAYLTACHEKDQKKIEVIQDLSKKAQKTKEEFSDEVINNGLQLILEAY